ncbi:MAG: peptidylprolyl isomerase, partial [Acidimicrobiia bacterium]
KFRDELEGSGTYERGTLAMANAGPNTNGSQFFIMHRDYGLPHNYTIFGKVTDGLDIVDAIAALDTDPGDRPAEAPSIKSITLTGV